MSVENLSLENFAASFYEKVAEPASFNDLVNRLNQTGLNFSDYLGDLSNPNDRDRAALHLQNAPEKLVALLIGGKVNGFIFDPADEKTVKALIDIKSMAGTERWGLFACVTNLETVNELVDGKVLEKLNLKNILEECFIRLPIKENLVTRLPDELKSKTDNQYFVQFFITKPDSYLNDIFKKATNQKHWPILGGTSANFSKSGSIIHGQHAAIFDLGLGSFYLFNPGAAESNKRGSFTIASWDKTLSENRPGNLPFEVISQKLGLS